LLIAVAAAKSETLCAELEKRGVLHAEVGQIVGSSEKGSIRLCP
jgi:hypothetical protein